MSRTLWVAAVAAALAACPAAAHVVADPPEGPAGGYFRTALRVTHGCDGAATVALTVEVPPDILTIRPQAKPGWTITVTREALPRPVPGPHGSTITQRVVSIRWAGGTLPDEQFDEFGLSFQLPKGAAGSVVALPTIQTCERGEHRWVERAGPGGERPAHPAPLIRLRDAAHAHH